MSRAALTSRPLTDIDTVFLDLDGCVWFGSQLAQGARETITWLRANGKRVFFLTNVSSATRQGMATKLSELGIPTRAEEVLVPLELLPAHPYFEQGQPAVYALCAADVRQVMQELGFTVTTNPEEAEVVVVGRDPDMTYHDLAAATQAIYTGAKLLALNLDARVPMKNGVIIPGNGAIVAALREATGAPVEAIGKPSVFFFETALATFGALPERTVMVGDTLDSDILGGLRAGLTTVHVGGSTYSTQVPPPEPDLRLEGLHQLIGVFQA